MRTKKMNLSNIKYKINWRFKILLKLVLSRLPLNYAFWSRLDLFKHGDSNKIGYIYGVLRKHISFSESLEGKEVLEVGPGDGILSAVLAFAMGAKSTTLLDVNSYAEKNIKKYLEEIKRLEEEFPVLKIINEKGPNDMEDLLKLINAKYLTEGLNSLKSIESNQFDFIFSQAVLEHIRKKEFKETILEMKRVLKPSGVMSHAVDFKDHLGGSFNNLRFSNNFWEQDWFAYQSGFYTNRIQLSELRNILEEVGFDNDVKEIKKRDMMPNPEILHQEFSKLDKSDLEVGSAHIISTITI